MSSPLPFERLTMKPNELQIVGSILARHIPHLEVWVFGSRVKGTQKPFSDLDLAVICGQPLSLDLQAALKDDFSESDLPYKVDIVDWATASAAFQERIRVNYVVLQASPSANPAPAPRASAEQHPPAAGS